MDSLHVFVGPHSFGGCCCRWRQSSRGCRGVYCGSRVGLSWRSRVSRRSRLVRGTSLRARHSRHQYSRCKGQGRDKQQRSPIHDASSTYVQTACKRPASDQKASSSKLLRRRRSIGRKGAGPHWDYCAPIVIRLNSRWTGDGPKSYGSPYGALLLANSCCAIDRACLGGPTR
jgi:hypothetical protein